MVIGCLARLREPVLGWIFLVVILLYALAHIVFEFYQPYIVLLRLPLFAEQDHAPLLSGLVISISMFGGALGARASIDWQARLGLLGVLAVAMLIQLGIVAAMAMAISPLVLALVCLRNFPMALVHAPIRAAIAPRIGREQRATYLSLQGLAERLCFALLLLWLAARLEPGAAIAAATLHGILESTLWFGVLAAAALSIAAPRIRRLLLRDGTG